MISLAFESFTLRFYSGHSADVKQTNSAAVTFGLHTIVSVQMRYSPVQLHRGDSMTQRCVGKLVLSTTVLLILLGALRALGQGGAGFDLTLIDVEGNKTVLGTLPPSTYAPRISPDGKRIAFETRDPNSPDGA